MGETTNYDLPFPEGSDKPDGPDQIGDLAGALDVVEWGTRSLAPFAGQFQSSESLNLTTEYQNIVGASLAFTADVAERILLLATFTIESTAAAAMFEGLIAHNGSDFDSARPAIAKGDSVYTTVPYVATRTYNAGAQTFQMRAKESNGNVFVIGSRCLYLRLAQV